MYKRVTQILWEVIHLLFFFFSCSFYVFTFQLILAHVAEWDKVEIKLKRRIHRNGESAIRKRRRRWNKTLAEHTREETATKPKEHCAFVADTVQETLRGFCMWTYCLLACQNIEHLEASGAIYCSFSMPASLLLETQTAVIRRSFNCGYINIISE